MKKYVIDSNQLSLFSLTAITGTENAAKQARITTQKASASVEVFETTLKSATELEWEIVWTRNRSTLISFRRDQESHCLRIHEIFRMAPAGLALIISEVIEGRLQPWPREIDAYIQQHMHDLQRMQPTTGHERTLLQTAGRFHNIRQIFEEFNRDYFNNSVKSQLAWMLPKSRRPRSLHLGNYTEQSDIIKIHPILDSREVPRYVIADTIFHEMTHAFLKTRTRNGRRITHGRDFWKKMEEYPQHAQAEAWLENNLGKLLRNYSRLAAQIREVRDRANPSADARRR